MKKNVMLVTVFFFCAHISWAVHALESNSSLMQVSRQCIKIWCLMRNLVDDKESVQKEMAADAESIDLLDALLCRIMRVRDAIAHIDTRPHGDMQTAEYIDSSLDCIESYTYDLIKQYPGSWSVIIQEQVFRTQDAYMRCVAPLLTK